MNKNIRAKSDHVCLNFMAGGDLFVGVLQSTGYRNILMTLEETMEKCRTYTKR
jgi:hypothetical protein